MTERILVKLMGTVVVALLVGSPVLGAGSTRVAGEEAFARVIASASHEGWLEISPRDAAQEIDSARTFVLDVRSPSEWERNGHVPGATLIPIADLPNDLDALPTDLETPVVVYCAVGTRGLYATLFLVLAGYDNVRNIAGGFRAWSDAGLPEVGAPAGRAGDTSPTIGGGGGSTRCQ